MCPFHYVFCINTYRVNMIVTWFSFAWSDLPFNQFNTGSSLSSIQINRKSMWALRRWEHILSMLFTDSLIFFSGDMFLSFSKYHWHECITKYHEIKDNVNLVFSDLPDLMLSSFIAKSLKIHPRHVRSISCSITYLSKYHDIKDNVGLAWQHWIL